MKQPYDVLVVGGGLVGLTAALAMARCGCQVALIDAGPLVEAETKPVGPDKRVYAINKASIALLNELQVGRRMEHSNLAPYQKMHVWDAANGAFIDFDARSIAEPYLGFIAEEWVLKAALLEEIKEHASIVLFPNTTSNSVRRVDQAIEIRGDQGAWQASLLLVADGAQSPTRAQLEVPLTQWSYGQKALVATVHTELPHQKTAYQVFTKQGPLAFLPLVDQQACSIVWSTELKHAEFLLSLSDSDFNQELTTTFSRRLGDVKLTSPRTHYPLQMRHVKHYVGKRWMLVGDAAHTIHPLAGLGLNVGLADVATWYHQVQRDKNALFSSKQLGLYQRQRKNAVWQTILLMEGFKFLFSSSFPPITTLRGLGLTGCNLVTPLKRLFIQHAAGAQ